MIRAFLYPQEAAQLDAFLAENPVHHRKHDGDKMLVFTGEDIPVDPVPEFVSRRQLWEVLIEDGMLEAAMALAKAAGPSMENHFMNSSEYQRSHPKTIEAIALFGMTPEQGDALFMKAATR